MKFLGFYTYPKLSIKKFTDEDFSSPDFAKNIRSVIFSHENDKWKLVISADGLVQFCDFGISNEIEQIYKTWEGDLSQALSFDEVWGKYLTILNVIYFLLDCSMHLDENIFALEFCELKYTDTTLITYDEQSIPIRQANYGGLDLNEMIRFGDHNPLGDREFRIFILPESVLEKLASYYLEKILSNEEFVVILGRVAKSLSDHNLQNYDNSIVISWFILETYINLKWDNMIKAKNITGKRKEKLESRDYTASVKTEILEINGFISLELYEKLNIVRSKRNGIAHKYGKVISTKKDSIFALNVVKDVLEELVGLKFPFNVYGFSVHGL